MFSKAVFCAVLLTSCAFAQGTSPSGTNVIQASLAALTSGSPVQSITLNVLVRRLAGSADESGAAIATASISGDSRIDFNFPSGLASEIRNENNGHKSGYWAGSDGHHRAIAPHNLLVEDSGWFSPAILLRKLISNPSISLAYLGSEVRNGTAVEHVRATRTLPASRLPLDAKMLARKASTLDIYLSQPTLLPESVTFNTHSDTDIKTDIPVEVKFSNYQRVSGVQSPFRVQKLISGSVALDIRVQTVVPQ